MRTLLLLRHAKSSWDHDVADHDRPLAPRGVRAAQHIAAYLGTEGVRPTLVLCSSARRTVETLDALRPVLGDKVDARIEAGLYGADAGEILERLRAVDASVPSVMVIGHNPGLEDLAATLAGDGNPTAIAQLRTKFPTGALATVAVRSTWAQLTAGRASLSHLVLPRQLGGSAGGQP